MPFLSKLKHETETQNRVTEPSLHANDKKRKRERVTSIFSSESSSDTSDGSDGIGREPAKRRKGDDDFEVTVALDEMSNGSIINDPLASDDTTLREEKCIHKKKSKARVPSNLSKGIAYVSSKTYCADGIDGGIRVIIGANGHSYAIVMDAYKIAGLNGHRAAANRRQDEKELIYIDSKLLVGLPVVTLRDMIENSPKANNKTEICSMLNSAISEHNSLRIRDKQSSPEMPPDESPDIEDNTRDITTYSPEPGTVDSGGLFHVLDLLKTCTKEVWMAATPSTRQSVVLSIANLYSEASQSMCRSGT